MLIVSDAQLNDPAVNLQGCHITSVISPDTHLRTKWLLWGPRNCRRVEPRLRRGRGFMTHRFSFSHPFSPLVTSPRDFSELICAFLILSVSVNRIS